MRNLQELGASPFPYIVPVLPCPLLDELVKGKHFVLSDLLKLIPRGSSQDDSSLETFVQSDCLPLSTQDPKHAQLPLARRDSQPTSQAAKKKKKKIEQDKVVE